MSYRGDSKSIAIQSKKLPYPLELVHKVIFGIGDPIFYAMHP